MSEPENFLTRWSRRKLKADENPTADKKPEMPVQAARAPAENMPPQTGSAAEPVFDLSKLPSLDSITAETDIRAFWLPGVPESLRHAALRRVWVADPAIRDFVGLAEYAWDFTAPDSIQGFGPLDPAEVPRLMEKFLRPHEPDAAKVQQASTTTTLDQAQPAPTTTESVGETGQAINPSEQETNSVAPGETGLISGSGDLLQRSEEAPAMAKKDKHVAIAPAHGRRGHGRALPR